MSQATTAATQTPSSASFRRAGNYVFWLMWGMNFINYVDRWTFTVVSPAIQKEFQLSDAAVGFLSTAFLLTYTIGILPLGVLADRIKRTRVVAGGVAFWSFATILTGIVPNFGLLFATRAALGLGEGSYYPAGTSLLSSYNPMKDRARVMSRWGTGSLAGIAVGFLLGGIIAQSLGWRTAFYFFGPPGLILALLMFFVREPPRAAADEAENAELALSRRGWAGIRADLGDLLRVRTLRVVTLVYILGFFAITASTSFLPILLTREYGLSEGTIGIISGAVLIVGGIIGLLLGGQIADRLIQRMPGARVFVGGLGFMLAVPFFVAAVFAAIAFQQIPLTIRLYGLFVPFFLIAVIMLNVYSGPTTAVVQDVVPPFQRAASVGLLLMVAHFVGDLFSPTIVGVVSDLFKSNVGVTPFLQQVGITQTNALGVALLIFCVPALLAAGIIGMRGAAAVARDEEAARVAAVAPLASAEE